MTESVKIDEEQFEAWNGFFNAIDPRKGKLNTLLLALPIAVYAAYFAHNETLAFVASMIAIMPLAFLMGQATEEIALRTGEALGGLLNATFGNAAEMIIAAVAIFAAASFVLMPPVPHEPCSELSLFKFSNSFG